MGCLPPGHFRPVIRYIGTVNPGATFFLTVFLTTRNNPRTMRYRSEALKFFREQRGLRVEDLAVRARVSSRQIRYIENGSVPRADTLGLLANALGLSVESFYRKTA